MAERRAARASSSALADRDRPLVAELWAACGFATEKNHRLGHRQAGRVVPGSRG